MNDTINYYNKNAEQYYKNTVDVDFTDAYKRFLKYIPKGGRIIDVGCGSGRDTAAFKEMGYDAIGLDASEELAEVARKGKGIDVIVEDMASWITDEPYDGIWSCASLLHLDNKELISFFQNLNRNLKVEGAIYISVKTAIETGVDNKGRFMKNFTEEELRGYLDLAGIEIVETWDTGDQLNREGFSWINVIGIKR